MVKKEYLAKVKIVGTVELGISSEMDEDFFGGVDIVFSLPKSEFSKLDDCDEVSVVIKRLRDEDEDDEDENEKSETLLF